VERRESGDGNDSGIQKIKTFGEIHKEAKSTSIWT